MPHAEAQKLKKNVTGTNNMSATITNGQRPSSLFLSHLTTYPVIADAVKTYKQNPYGAKSLDIVQIIYDKFVAPFTPYFRTPYSIVHPYLNKADSLADNGLHKVDEKFPVVKEETASIKNNVVGIAYLPIQKADDGKNYVLKTYNDEHRKVGGEGVVKFAKAVVSTELKIASDTFDYATSFFFAKKEEVKKQVNKKTK